MSGGSPATVFELDPGRGEISQSVPYFLPDGKHFLYTSLAKETAFMLGSLDGKTRRVLMPGGGESPASYARNPAGGGWILYIRGSQLMARSFDPGKGELTGDAAVVADSMFNGPSWSASANGFLAFRRIQTNQTQLTWFNRDGKPLGTDGDPGNFHAARISPDQKSLAFYNRPNGRSADIWLFDLTRGITSRFTSEPGRYAAYPVWSPDGNHLLYWTRTPNVLVKRPVNGIGPETILKSQPNTSWVPSGVSRDGRWVVVLEIGGARRRILLATWPDGKSVPLVEGESPGDGSLSPDGRWLLYKFAPGDGRAEVFVQSLPEEAGGSPSAVGKWQISTGGTSPVWRADGKEIFYLALDGKLMVVPVESGENFFRPGTQRPLFQTHLSVEGGRLFGREYDVTPDGQRFLLTQPVADTGDVPITVIVNWPQLLKK